MPMTMDPRTTIRDRLELAALHTQLPRRHQALHRPVTVAARLLVEVGEARGLQVVGAKVPQVGNARSL